MKTVKRGVLLHISSGNVVDACEHDISARWCYRFMKRCLYSYLQDWPGTYLEPDGSFTRASGFTIIVWECSPMDDIRPVYVPKSAPAITIPRYFVKRSDEDGVWLAHRHERGVVTCWTTDTEDAVEFHTQALAAYVARVTNIRPAVQSDRDYIHGPASVWTPKQQEVKTTWPKK